MGDRHPRHIRLGKSGDDSTERPSLVFHDRISLQRVGRATPRLLVLAILIVAVGLVASSYLRRSGEAAGEPARAGEEAARPFGPLSPSGEAEASLVIFSWAPHPLAESYELRLEDAQGRTVWTALVGRETRVALPDDVAHSLETGAPYVWRVVALLSGGRREESGAMAFVLR